MLLLQPVAFGSVGSSTQLISGRHSSNPVRASIFLRTIHCAQLYLNSIHTSNEMCFITNRFLNHFKCRLPKEWPVDSQPSLLMWPLKLSAIIKHFWICRATSIFIAVCIFYATIYSQLWKKLLKTSSRKLHFRGGCWCALWFLTALCTLPLQKRLAKVIWT